jgi:voltage-gated potassium channel
MSSTPGASPINVVLFGYNRLGREVADHLRSVAGRCRLLVVDDAEDHLTQAEDQGLETAAIDYTQDSELVKIGIGKDIDIIFCLLPSDAQNVYLTISARALAPQLQIVSVSDAADAAAKLRAAGADKVIDPYDIIGRKIFDLIERPLIADVLERIVFGREDLYISELEIGSGSQLTGRRLQDGAITAGYHLLLIGMVDDAAGGFLFASEDGERRLQAGDTLLLIGPGDEFERFKRDLSGV